MLTSSIALALLSAAAASALAARESCYSNEFWWEEKSCCLPEGGPSALPSPPSGKACPDEWYWGEQFTCCVPKTTPSTPATPSCPEEYSWTAVDQCCSKPTTTTPSCAESEFWWEPTSCCLPHGGQPSPPSPPTGNACPSSWDWHEAFSCCVPHEPTTPPSTCGNGWPFSGIDQCCKQPWPVPSYKPKKSGWKKARGSHVFECGMGLKACAIGHFDWECIDPMQDLTTCGGCVGPDEIGQDCTEIANANAVGCDAGRCAVYSCNIGYSIGRDGKSCTKKSYQIELDIPKIHSHSIQ